MPIEKPKTEPSLAEIQTSNEKEPAVEHLGSFDEILQKLKKEGTSFEHAQELVNVFNSKENLKLLGKEKIEVPIIVAGGFVRDVKIGKTPKDIDLSTSLTRKEMLQVLEHHCGGKDDRKFRILDDIYLETKSIANPRQGESKAVALERASEFFQTLKIQFYDTGEIYEINTLREEGEYTRNHVPEYIKPTKSLRIDAMRRNLTVNGIFYDPTTGNAIDYVGGLKDIENKTIRFIGDPEKKIEEDAIRLFQYVYTLTKTEFEEDPASHEAVEKLAHNIQYINRQRTCKELKHVFRAGHYDKLLDVFKKTGMLKYLFHEVDKLDEQKFEYTKLVAGKLPPNSSDELVTGTWMHQITSSNPHKDKIHNQAHELQDKNTNRVVHLARDHGRILALPDMKEREARAQSRVGYFDEAVQLIEARIEASKTPGFEGFAEKDRKFIDAAKKRHEQLQKHEKVLDKIEHYLDGDKIKEKLSQFDKAQVASMTKEEKDEWGQQKGRVVGVIRRLTYELIAEKNITNAKKAEEVLDEIIEAYKTVQGQEVTNSTQLETILKEALKKK